MDLIRKNIVERLRVKPQKDTHERHKPHGNEHRFIGLPWPQATVLGEKDKVRELDPGMEKDTSRCHFQYKPDPEQMLMHSPVYDQ